MLLAINMFHGTFALIPQFPHFNLWTCHRFNVFALCSPLLVGLEHQIAVKSKFLSLLHPDGHSKSAGGSAPHSQARDESTVFTVDFRICLVIEVLASGERGDMQEGSFPL